MSTHTKYKNQFTPWSLNAGSVFIPTNNGDLLTYLVYTNTRYEDISNATNLYFKFKNVNLVTSYLISIEIMQRLCNDRK